MPQTPPDPPRFRLPLQVDAGNLRLHRLSACDEDDLYEVIGSSLEHLAPWMEWTNDFSRTTVVKFIEAAGVRDDGPVSDAPYVVRNGAGELLGTCGLHARLGPHALEIGYWIASAHVRKGVATLAAAALTQVAFQLPEVQFVEIHHDAANTASGAIPAKLGYERVGSARVEQNIPAGTGRHWHWRITRKAWPDSTGARLLLSTASAAHPPSPWNHTGHAF